MALTSHPLALSVLSRAPGHGGRRSAVANQAPAGCCARQLPFAQDLPSPPNGEPLPILKNGFRGMQTTTLVRVAAMQSHTYTDVDFAVQVSEFFTHRQFLRMALGTAEVCCSLATGHT